MLPSNAGISVLPNSSAVKICGRPNLLKLAIKIRNDNPRLWQDEFVIRVHYAERV
jgi:hypothetical protein